MPETVQRPQRGCRAALATFLAFGLAVTRLLGQPPSLAPEPAPIEIVTCPDSPRLQPPKSAGQPYVFGASIDDPVPTGPNQIPLQGRDLPPGGKKIDLIGLIDTALRLNPATHQAWETANVSAANYLVAKGAYYPTVVLGEAVKSSYGRANKHPNLTHTLELDNAPTGTLTYLLLDFGGRKATIESSRLTLLASDFAVNQSIQTVVAQVLKAYYTVAYEEDLVRLYEHSLNFASQKIKPGADHLLDLASSRLQDATNPSEQTRQQLELQLQQFSLFGSEQAKQKAVQDHLDFKKERAVYGVTVGKSNLQQITVLKAQIKVAYDRSRADRATARIALAVSVGLPPYTELNIEMPPRDPPIVPLDGRVQSLIDFALEHRPDLANAFHTALAAAQTARAAHSNIWPTVNLNVTGGTTNANTLGYTYKRSTDTDVHTVGRADNVSASIGVTFTAFDGSVLRNKARSADFAAAASKAALANAELAAMADVAATYETYKWGIALYRDVTELRTVSSDNDDQSVKVLNKPTPKLGLFGTTADNPEDADTAAVLSAIRAHQDSDGAEAAVAVTRLNLYLYSYQLALSTGCLIPPITRGEAPSVRAIPVATGNGRGTRK